MIRSQRSGSEDGHIVVALEATDPFGQVHASPQFLCDIRIEMIDQVPQFLQSVAQAGIRSSGSER